MEYTDNNTNSQVLYFQYPIRLHGIKDMLLDDLILAHQLISNTPKMMTGIEERMPGNFRKSELVTSRACEGFEYITEPADEWPWGLDEEEADMISAGAGLFNIKVSAANIANDYAALSTHIESAPPTGLQVRVRKDIIESLRYGEMDEYEFKLIASLYAILGSAKAKKISFERIAAVAGGFTSIKEWKSLGEPCRLLTNRQVSYCLKKLEDRGFFTRLNPDNRAYWYSNRMDMCELEDWLFQRLDKSGEVRRSDIRKESNDRLQKRLTAAGNKLRSVPVGVAREAANW